MPSAFKCQKDLAEENPSGMEKLGNPANFSSNPGFLSTSGMLGSSMPANGDGIIRGTSARGTLRQGGAQRAVSAFNSR